MAPLSPDNTIRAKLHYNGPFAQHTLLVRGKTGTSQATLVADAHELAMLLSELQFNGTAWDRCEVAAAGSDLFFNDATWTPVVSSSGASTGTNNGVARFLEFGARSSGGRRVKYFVFEVAQQEDADYKVLYGSVGPIDDVIDLLNDETKSYAAIDGLPAVAYNYANIGDNDYWVHKARRGS